MSNAVMPISDYKNTCDVIREKIGKTDTIKSGELADKIGDVYEKGRKSWWADFQQQGNRKPWEYAFYGSQWTDKIYEPVCPFVVSNGYGMFHLTAITDTKVPIELQNSDVLTTNMFYTSKLVTIRLLKVKESNTFKNNMFSSATALVNITFEGVIANTLTMGACSKLSKESILSIFSCLSDTVSGMTLTLSKTAVNNAFTGEEWLTLVASKPNWTISLSE